MTKRILIIILFLLPISLNAQIQSIKLIAAGLTCSMCSKAIYKSLSNISSIKNVETDIENSSYIITFKDSVNINPDELKNAVTDAGFSVASMKISAKFNGQKISNDSHLIYEGLNFHFINVKEQNLKGIVEITIINKDFVDNKTYKKNEKYTKLKCYKSGQLEDCCTINNAQNKRVYQITLE